MWSRGVDRINNVNPVNGENVVEAVTLVTQPLPVFRNNQVGLIGVPGHEYPKPLANGRGVQADKVITPYSGLNIEVMVPARTGDVQFIVFTGFGLKGSKVYVFEPRFFGLPTGLIYSVGRSLSYT